MEPAIPVPEARALAPLTDHLLEEIFVRIDAPADIARASAACKRFRSLVTDPAFRRLYGSLHPPLLLGFIAPESTVSFIPAEAPHPNAPAADAFASAADFSINHLPDSGVDGWCTLDAHDRRILRGTHLEPENGLVLPELAVYDPLAQEYTLLPRIPDGLLTSVLVQVQHKSIRYINALFDPSWCYQEEQFRVMCWTCCQTMVVIFIYSSVSGSWTHGSSIGWDALGLDGLLPEGIVLNNQCPNYAHGCLYWQLVVNKFIKVNINSMELSGVSYPPYYDCLNIVVVEAGEGRIGVFSLFPGRQNHLLRGFIRQNESDNVIEHPVETTIPLPNDCDIYRIDSAARGYIFVVGIRMEDIMEDIQDAQIFSVEIKTMKVERVSNSGPHHHLIPYFGFPQFM